MRLPTFSSPQRARTGRVGTLRRLRICAKHEVTKIETVGEEYHGWKLSVLQGFFAGVFCVYRRCSRNLLGV